MKFSKLLAVAAIPFAVTVQAETDLTRELCRIHGNIAENGMRYRQAGGTFDELMSTFQMASIYRHTFEDIFKYPRMETREEREKVARLYGEVTRMRCLGMIE